MSEAFKCEVCDTYFSSDKLGQDQQVKVRVNKNAVIVSFTVSMEEGFSQGDICYPCMMKALAQGLTKILQDGEKK